MQFSGFMKVEMHDRVLAILHSWLSSQQITICEVTPLASPWLFVDISIGTVLQVIGALSNILQILCISSANVYSFTKVHGVQLLMIYYVYIWKPENAKIWQIKDQVEGWN